MNGLVKDVALTPAEPVAPEDALIRAATDPNMDMAKLSALIDMRERVMKIQAKEAFDRAFVQMQKKLPPIAERAHTNNGTYAPLEDIIEVVRPILAEHGFGLSHRTEWPEKGLVRVVGILTHEQGHERTTEFISGADNSGSKNAVQALGSVVQYGRRYTTKDLLNIVTRKEDNDGDAAPTELPPAPKGFDDWLDDLISTADTGFAALEAAWKKSRSDYRVHVTKHYADKLAKLKEKAKAVPA